MIVRLPGKKPPPNPPCLHTLRDILKTLYWPSSWRHHAQDNKQNWPLEDGFLSTSRNTVTQPFQVREYGHSSTNIRVRHRAVRLLPTDPWPEKLWSIYRAKLRRACFKIRPAHAPFFRTLPTLEGNAFSKLFLLV